MVEISIKNAKVNDSGYGLEVNGTSLEDIISNVLGTKAGNKGGYGSGLQDFHCNSCDITITIDPHNTECEIKNGTEIYHSVKELLEARKNEYDKKVAEADTEE